MTERYTPTEAEAEGMRRGILAERERQGLTGPHPYGLLDFSTETDRRVIAGVYADMARASIAAGLLRRSERS